MCRLGWTCRKGDRGPRKAEGLRWKQANRKTGRETCWERGRNAKMQGQREGYRPRERDANRQGNSGTDRETEAGTEEQTAQQNILDNLLHTTRTPHQQPQCSPKDGRHRVGPGGCQGLGREGAGELQG